MHHFRVFCSGGTLVFCLLVLFAPAGGHATNNEWESFGAGWKSEPPTFNFFGKDIQAAFRPYAGPGLTTGYEDQELGGLQGRGGLQALYAFGSATLFFGVGLDLGAATISSGFSTMHAVPFIELTAPYFVLQAGCGAWTGLEDRRGTWPGFMLAVGFSYQLDGFYDQLAVTALLRADVFLAQETPVLVALVVGLSWYIWK